MPSRNKKRAWALAAASLAALSSMSLPGTARADAPAGANAAAPTPSASSASTTADTATAPAAPAAAIDDKPARPPPLPPLEPAILPWGRTVDIGGDLSVVERPASSDVKGNPSSIRYEAATGFALHIRWSILENLQIAGYFVDCHLPVSIPRGALGLDAGVTTPPVETFVFGLRVSPSMAWGRLSGWLTAGAGWGRFEFQRMTATSSSGAFTLRERGASFVEIPLGLGASWQIVPRWLSIDFEATAAFVAGQHGEAFDHAQTVDRAGHLRDVGPLPVMDASFVQTIGFSLLL